MNRRLVLLKGRHARSANATERTGDQEEVDTMKVKLVMLKEAIPRIIADYILVHLCMIAASAASVIYQLEKGDATPVVQLADRLAHFYVIPFVTLSCVFPLVFLAHGFYTRSRPYLARHKRMVLIQGSLTAVFAFFALNYLIFPRYSAGRTAVVLFSIFVPITITGVRDLKDILVRFNLHTNEPVARVSVQSESTQDRVLVVGGAGYIGSILVRNLLDAGHRVRILDNLLYGYQPIQSVLSHPRLELEVGDCRNIQSVVKAAQGIKSVVHLAAIVGDPACEHDRRTALETNYAATRMMIEVAKGNGVRRFVFASSCSVYGASDFLCDENTAPKPLSLYAETKINSEKALQDARTDTFHPTSLRFATVFGDSYRLRFDLVVNLLTAKAKQDNVITIFNGQQWRPFLHVRDVANAIMTVLQAPIPVVSGEIFNVGDSRLNYTLDQVADCIREEFPETRIERIDNTDLRNYRVSFDKVKTRLGFNCSVGLQDGIRQLKDVLEKSPTVDYNDPIYSNVRYLQAMGIPEYKDTMDGRIMAALAEPTTAVMDAAA
jgi:nucleoside-diphosphate-sugar epimerase